MLSNETLDEHEGSDSAYTHFFVVVSVAVVVYVILLNLDYSPLGRDTTLISALAGVGAGAVGRPVRYTVQIVRGWMPLAFALLAYDAVRARVDGTGTDVAVEGIIRLERLVSLGTLPARDWYEAVGGANRPFWLALLTDLVWMSHFFVPLGFAGYLWLRRREHYSMYAITACTLFVLAMVAYWIQPSAPPWYAATSAGGHMGELGPIVRTSGQGLERLGIEFITSNVQRGTNSANPFAAFPSLHGGVSILVAYFITTRLTSHRLRWWVWTYPAAMTFAVVSTGEHYLVDVIAVIPFIAAAWMIAERVTSRARTGDKVTSSSATR